MLIIGNDTVRRALDGRDGELIDAVGQAYRLHQRGETALPHSVFLRFPDDDRNRIIGLPAYLGGGRPLAGMKWIASFPGNVAAGIERASAVIILNDMATGRPVALLEASTISARRTAGSAALASTVLSGPEPVTGVTVVGCGLINAETLRLLRVLHPGLRRLTVFDLDADRAEAFAARSGLDAVVAPDLDHALAANPLVSMATTASAPHTDLSACAPGTLVLHLSLRDVTVDAILAAHNVVDDVDHVSRAATSVHLTEQRVGGRGFIGAELGALLLDGPDHPRPTDRVTVFSPFGLGVLDLAVAELVLRVARESGEVTEIEGFLPAAPVAAG
ncbi:MAG TPA: 2,3-diaminopropionate biosynthesis protein SbnB [Actinophytocola sp.]|nr:2,3-diaminopropionate biosynthesis protein SbnB [Actinophytocola sp.]